MKSKAVVVDLDGTLCNVEHRRHFITGGNKEWGKYNDACGDDTPHDWCVELVLCLMKSHIKILFASGREESMRKTTEWWIEKHMKLLPTVDYKLFMRPDKDYRPDQIVKKELYDTCILPMYEVVFVVDDRKKVVDMWRAEGLTVLQCAEGDF